MRLSLRKLIARNSIYATGSSQPNKWPGNTCIFTSVRVLQPQLLPFSIQISSKVASIDNVYIHLDLFFSHSGELDEYKGHSIWYSSFCQPMIGNVNKEAKAAASSYPHQHCSLTNHSSYSTIFEQHTLSPCINYSHVSHQMVNSDQDSRINSHHLCNIFETLRLSR